MGRFADVNEEEVKRIAEEYMEEANAINVNDRCMIEVSDGGLKKRGVVLYVGLVEFKQGYWVGVQYDEPLGKHNGT